MRITNKKTVISNYERKDWNESLGALQFTINCTVWKSTGKAPIELLIGKKGCVPTELLSIINEENKRVDPNELRHAVLGQNDWTSSIRQVAFR